jgi:hypothetical protein
MDRMPKRPLFRLREGLVTVAAREQDSRPTDYENLRQNRACLGTPPRRTNPDLREILFVCRFGRRKP